MASKDSAPAFTNLPDGSSLRIGIVVAEWNSTITNSLLEAARQTLLEAKVPEDQIDQLYVPGSFELPWGARHLIMKAGKLDAVICLGCIIQGETRHDEYIAQAVSNGTMQLGLATGIPVIFGVLTTRDADQAAQRAGGKHGNKGSEAAMTALRMAAICKASGKKKIGFDK